MTNDSSHDLQITRKAAELGVRQLLDRLGILAAGFPDLRDAFDPDELPLEFILKRDSQAGAAGGAPKRIPARATAPIGRTLPYAVERRGGQRKRISDE